ncbi:3'-5' exonuclease family protein [Chitinimonas lacunae]|uniref:DNA-directed DNA polymerase n=1 Tax=Chitinimonas lacunae TaxID=1963018 RepID=A0ABV8MJ48_9NEIS
MSLLFSQPFVFVDLETTGANASRDRITEIGVVEWRDGQVEEWSTLVNPGVPIPPFISRLTGISDEMVIDAPSFTSIAEAVHERLAGRVFVAHNARFDYGFLKNEFKRVGLPFRARVICTVKLSRRLFPEEYKHNLDAVVARHQLEAAGDRHRALTDARLIERFMAQLRERLGDDALNAVLEELSRQPTLPPGLDPEVIDDLPDGHGVYLFYGQNDVPLYVGKSNHLRKRVLAHFAADHRADKEMRMAQQVTRIDWVETAGELGALLTEAKLVKSLQPAHNHQLRRQQDLCAWRFEPNAEGDAKPELVFARDIDFGRTAGLHGLYTSQREATNSLRKLAEVNKLCPIMLGLEKPSRRGNGPCFAYQVGKCRGACVGKEAATVHQARVGAMLAKFRLSNWPYPGLIAIRERASSGEAADLHLVDHWHYLGTVSDESALHELLDQRPSGTFELDDYKILSKFLKSTANAEVVLLDP